MITIVVHLLSLRGRVDTQTGQVPYQSDAVEMNSFLLGHPMVLKHTAAVNAVPFTIWKLQSAFHDCVCVCALCVFVCVCKELRDQQIGIWQTPPLPNPTFVPAYLIELTGCGGYWVSLHTLVTAHKLERVTETAGAFLRDKAHELRP
eukprot:1960986-Amphidinium_carterae.1